MPTGNKTQRCNNATRKAFTLLWVALVLLCAACTKKIVLPPVQGQDTVEYIVKDCTIVLPADTAALFLRWSELCDTTNRTATAPIAITKKRNRLTVTVTPDTNGIVITCREDSLLHVIEKLNKQVKQQTLLSTLQEPSRLQQYTTFALAIAVAVWGVAMLLRR